MSRKGIARAARLVHTHVFAKLAAAIARQKKLQQCRRFTWQFAFKIFKLLPSNHELRSLLCMNMNEYCNIGPRRNTIVTQLFHSSYSRHEFQTSIVWKMRGAWKTSSLNQAHSLTCGRAYGCTMALVAAIINVIATDSCKPFALATTETKNTATSFWTISIQILLPGYARRVKRVKKQQILRCSEVGKMSNFYLKTFS